MNRVESIEIFTDSSYGWLVAEYLKAKTLYNINYIGKVPKSEEWDKGKGNTILLVDVVVPGLLEYLECKLKLAGFFSTAAFNCKRDDSFCVYLVKRGIKGIFYDDEEFNSIERGITLLAQAKVRMSRSLLYRAVCMREGELYRESLDKKLTQREVEVFFLVKEGFSNREIADKLYISLYTVKKHLSNIFRKVDVDGRVAIRNWKYRRMKRV